MGIDQQGRGRAEAFKRVEDEKEQRQPGNTVSTPRTVDLADESKTESKTTLLPSFLMDNN